ncbi:MAG: hypothetical protein A2Y38_22920, partial [Spirochaetes bacterium GWB1_59_5]
MKKIARITIPVLLLGFALGVAIPAAAQQAGVLSARKVGAAPAVDGVIEAAWNALPALSFKAVGGRNFANGSTEATIKAMYTSDALYLLLQYKDPTDSQRRSPWQKQGDGAWKKLADPADKGGDNNLYYEDKFAFIWDISSPSFARQGCAVACHVGEGKPYGNKYVPEEGARLDLWHWKGVRTGAVGQVDDQYVDSTRYEKEKAPEAGRKSDPKTGGGYADNVSEDKKGPRFALPGDKPAPPFWILDREKQPLDSTKYKPGDEVPGILVSPFTGDRGEISARETYQNGLRTMEIARKLVTGSEFDVQFSDLKKEYPFGVALFDNAQVRHAFSTGA